MFAFGIYLAMGWAYADQIQKQQEYVTRQKDVVRRLLRTVSEMKELRVEYDALGGSAYLSTNTFTGAYGHITKDEFISVIVTEEAVINLLKAHLGDSCFI
jgi:hypothetical protein